MRQQKIGTQPALLAGCVRIVTVLMLLAILPVHQPFAGDEEFNPSIYQVFDPETGYFIDVEPGPDDKQADPAQAQPAPASPAAAEVMPGSDTVAAANEASNATSGASSLNPMLITAGAIALVLVAGFAVRKRKDEH